MHLKPPWGIQTPLGDPLTGYLAPYDPYVLLDGGVRRQFDRRRCL